MARDDGDVTWSNLPDCLQDPPRCDAVLKTTGELCFGAVLWFASIHPCIDLRKGALHVPLGLCLWG